MKQRQIKITTTLIAGLIIVFITAFSRQPGGKESFDAFANRYDSLFIKAYEDRDIAGYNKLLATYLARYDKLDSLGKIEYKPRLASSYYNFACLYSLQKQKDKALDYLEKSIRAGYMDYSHINEDPDLDYIRKEPRYVMLTEPLRLITDYLFILKNSGGYNNKKEAVALPSFTYESMNDSQLVMLRKTFRLDSIAGTGNELSRLLNLMHWIHNLVPHDGSNPNPAVRNAMSLVRECKKEDRGLNCRGLAIVLNEAYLSMGYSSRILTCLPKDSLGIDNDCHVITVVYSQMLQKWVWLDPTWDAYVMDENGNMLSVEEVRERLVDDRPLILNPDANWNHKSSATRETYLKSYMAKNLYMLESPVRSCYNMETWGQAAAVSYIQLLPLGDFRQEPRKTERNNNGTAIITYKTNNEKLFWAAPAN